MISAQHEKRFSNYRITRYWKRSLGILVACLVKRRMFSTSWMYWLRWIVRWERWNFTRCFALGVNRRRLKAIETWAKAKRKTSFAAHSSERLASRRYLMQLFSSITHWARSFSSEIFGVPLCFRSARWTQFIVRRVSQERWIISKMKRKDAWSWWRQSRRALKRCSIWTFVVLRVISLEEKGRCRSIVQRKTKEAFLDLHNVARWKIWQRENETTYHIMPKQMYLITCHSSMLTI